MKRNPVKILVLCFSTLVLIIFAISIYIVNKPFLTRNLIENPSFEEHSEVWGCYEVIDDISVNASSCSLYDSNTNKLFGDDFQAANFYNLSSEGSHFLRLEAPKSANEVYAEQLISVSPDKLYLLSVDLQVIIASEDPVVEVIDAETGEILNSFTSNYWLAQMGWVRIGGVVNPTSDRILLRLKAYKFDSYLSDSRDNTGIYAYDNVNLVEIRNKDLESSNRIASALEAEIQEGIIVPKILEKDLPRKFEKSLDKEYARLEIPIYDLEFEKEEDFWDRKHEEIRQDSMPASLRVNNSIYDVDIKLRGLNPWHWQTPIKSFELSFDETPPFLKGEKKIDLLRPVTRGVLSESYSYYLAKKIGLVSLRDDFVFLRINGRPYGLLYQIEDWDKPVLERNIKPEANLFGNENFKYVTLRSSSDWKKFTDDPYAKEDFEEVMLLTDFVNYDFKKEFEKFIDTDNLIDWDVHAVLAGTKHQGYVNNNRLYFNNSTGKFEFIPWDVQTRLEVDPESDYNKTFFYTGDEPRNPFSDYLFRQLEFFDDRNARLWNYISEPQNIFEDVTYFEDLLYKVKTPLLMSRHYGLTEGSTLVQSKEVISVLEKVPERIVTHAAEVKEILSRSSGGVEYSMHKIEPLVYALDLKLVDNGEFSSSRLSAIEFDFEDANWAPVVGVYHDDGDNLFDVAVDSELIHSEMDIDNNVLPISLSFESASHYETYVNKLPDVIHPIEFNRLLSLAFPMERTIMTSIYLDSTGGGVIQRYELDRDNLTEPKSQIIKKFLGRIGFIPKRKNTERIFIKFPNETLDDFEITLKAVNASTGEDIPVDRRVDLYIPNHQEYQKTLTLEKLLEQRITLKGSEPEDYRFKYLPDSHYSPEEFGKVHTFFERIDPTTYALSEGRHEIDSNIIVPYGVSLKIMPGAELIFAENKSLLVYGDISALGREENLIYFQGNKDNWGVVALVGRESEGEFENCVFEGGNDAYINGTYFSGMLSSHLANTTVRNCEFLDASKKGGDDAVNFKYSSSSIRDSTFKNNRGDAIDYDVMSGEILNNRFEDTLNDAIDVSNSSTVIKDNFVRDSGDKCISVGEKSNVEIVNNILDSCNIGIEIKDLSDPLITNNVISRNQLGVNLYMKKEEFGGGRGRIYNTLFVGNNKDVAENASDGSEISIENSNVTNFRGRKNTHFSLDTDELVDSNWFINLPHLSRVANRDILYKYCNVCDEDYSPIGLFKELDVE